ncbi:MAG: tyrosine-type recombinase/integrase [Acidobacteriota bacterium]
MVYKRWMSKKVNPGDENYDRARWWMEYRLNGRRVHHVIPGARTKAQAQRAEVSEREAIYNRRYHNTTDVGFTAYYDEYYLPWLREKKASRVRDAESRVKKLKAYFGNRFLREITRRDIERFQASLRDKKTKRKTLRKGGTVNRYIYLLSAIFSRAAIDAMADFNPCARFEQEPESKRERYLTPAEQTRLMDALVDDLEFLRAPIEVSLGTGMRKRTELLQLRIENINFSGFPIFRRANGRDVEVRPNWFLLTDTKGKKPRHRLIPMNAPVKDALLSVIQNRTTGQVFNPDHTGVTEHVLRTAFERACDRAEIPFGLAVEGGLIWHDLRRTFATELRARQVHEYDIADLLGHHIQAVTGTYARSTPEVLEEAVNKLALPRGNVIEFKRKAS